VSTSTTRTTTTTDLASAGATSTTGYAAGLDEDASSYVSDPETRPVRIQGYPKRRPARDARLAVVPPLGRRRSVAAGPSYGDFFAEASSAAAGGSVETGA
jgi:hypothetical protein